jgi:hypothetical protein
MCIYTYRFTGTGVSLVVRLTMSGVSYRVRLTHGGVSFCEAYLSVGELGYGWWKMWGIRNVTARVVTRSLPSVGSCPRDLYDLNFPNNQPGKSNLVL